MTQDKATGPRGFGCVAIAAVFLASLALNAMLFWKWFGKEDWPRGTSGVTAPEAERLGERPPSQSPGIPPRPEKTREGRQWKAGPSRPDEENRTVPGVESEPRGRGPDASQQDAAGSQESAQHREVGAPNPPGGADSRNGPAPAAAAAASAPESPEAVPVGRNSRAEGPAASPAGLQTGRLVSSTGRAASPGAGVALPEETTPPPEVGAASSDEGTTPEAVAPVEAEPGSDRTPPLLEVLRFDPPVVEGGNVTTLTVQASDDLSGMKSFTGEIRSPNGLATLPFWSRAAGGGNLATFAITVPREAETGVWYVSWISLIDGADNSSLIRASSAAAAPPGGTLTVSSPESDSVAPEVFRIWFDKTAIDAGDRHVIEVEARDGRSGVTSIKGACQSPSKSALIWFSCALNEESGVWEGDVLIPGNADCGEWGVQQLAARDKAGNTTVLLGNSPLLARATFQVSFRSDCDAVPPTLDAFELSPAVVSNETVTEILVTARVHDEGSGVVAVTGWFEGPVSTGGQIPKNNFRCLPDPKDPGAPWTWRVQVPQFAARGTWKVGVIRLQDKALNAREYTSADPVLSGSVFEVQ